MHDNGKRGRPKANRANYFVFNILPSSVRSVSSKSLVMFTCSTAARRTFALCALCVCVCLKMKMNAQLAYYHFSHSIFFLLFAAAFRAQLLKINMKDFCPPTNEIIALPATGSSMYEQRAFE